jgi:CHAD domain-containing protein
MVDKPALRPGAPIGPALRAAAGAILAGARAALQDPERSAPEAIHDFRRAMKQWRALLRLLRPFVADAPVRRTEARDRARLLAGARDGQSALNAFEDLVEHGAAIPAASIATIRARLENVRASQEQAVLTPALRQDLVDWLDNTATAVEAWPLDDLGFDAVARELARGYRAARRCISPDWSRAEAAEMHNLRQRVVDHRYQLELIEPLWPRLVRLWIDEAERLRDRLGKHQDLEVLEQLAAPHQPLARWRSRLATPCADRKADLARRAAHVARRLFAEPPKAFRRHVQALWNADR